MSVNEDTAADKTHSATLPDREPQNQTPGNAVEPAGAPVAMLLATLVIAVCGLVYELLAGTISSYLLGDSVYQFSIVIGVFMAAMGLGAYLTRFIHGALTDHFVVVQLALGVAGGLSAPILYFSFAALDNYQAMLLLTLVLTGTLVGVEIPLILRILREHQSLRVNLSNVLSLDYAGALIAALLFPIVLVPQLGLIRTSMLFGLLNVVVAALTLWLLRPLILRFSTLALVTVVLSTGLAGGLIYAERIEKFVETRLYAGEIIFAETSPYQRLVLTRREGVTNFYLNGGLQFSTIDEHRYHEALVHPAMSMAERHQQVLIIGGGDGLAAREVLRHTNVKQVTLVDLDPRVTGLFKDNEELAKLNRFSLRDPKVRIINADAGKFLEANQQTFDVVIIDLPDPHDIGLSRLYTDHFYTNLLSHVAGGGVVVTQATSPYYAREAFWCIDQTLRSVRSPLDRNRTLATVPYHAYVPTFGDWGFVAASPRTLKWDNIKLPPGLKYLNRDSLKTLRIFAPDVARVDVEPNTLQTHQLAQYYEQGWSRWYQ